MDSSNPCRGFRKMARKSLSMHCNDSDSSPFLSDTSSSDDEPYNTTHPHIPNTFLCDTSSYKTITKTHDTNLSYTRIRHPTHSSSLPTPDDRPQNRTHKSHYDYKLTTTTKGL